MSKQTLIFHDSTQPVPASLGQERIASLVQPDHPIQHLTIVNALGLNRLLSLADTRVDRSDFGQQTLEKNRATVCA